MKRMTLNDLLFVWDGFSPLWLNVSELDISTHSIVRMSDRYEDANDIPTHLLDYEVTYMTLDGNGELTLEVRG